MNAASAQTATRQRAPGSNKYWPAGGDEMGIDSQGRGVALVVTRKGAFAALSVAGFALLLVLYPTGQVTRGHQAARTWARRERCQRLLFRSRFALQRPEKTAASSCVSARPWGSGLVRDRF